MNHTIHSLLHDQVENHLLPFFWQHGEDEETLREYMKAIQDSGCGAVCVESRPHPDFCGPLWWRDMDIIIDEARIRKMKVWILDDSHFPTGYANGALENAPESICRQSICCCRNDFSGPADVIILDAASQVPPPFTPVGLEAMILPTLPKQRHFDDDAILCVIAKNQRTGVSLNLTSQVKDGILTWEKPDGDWTVWVTGLSRNCGPHRNYINMLDKTSCRLLIDAVYEKHWEHYAGDFGKTIAGFFSDEPELGNGHLYGLDDRIGTDQDLPFSSELPAELEHSIGLDWTSKMYLLWDNDASPQEKAEVRYAYMDAVTRLVRRDFSRQIGDWCEAHGVQYIGHVVEDNNAHARPASSLGHYFRGLDGQHMAGVDVISNQVMPQLTGSNPDPLGNMSDGEFYHYMLAKMASSAAAIEPRKSRNAMCEIFGNYGWGLSVSLQKYLADHFLVRGINYFVPHAFSPAPFPDPDCPPHFYAHGHNPQYRHFGEICRYMNRVCSLLSRGTRIAKTAVLYHAEAEWTGKCMLSQKPAHQLMDAQIDFDFLPCDVFSDPAHYQADLERGLHVNGRTYDALIIPASQFLPAPVAEAIVSLYGSGTKIYFIDSHPEGLCSPEDGIPGVNRAAESDTNSLLQKLRGIPAVSLEDLPLFLQEQKTMTAVPSSPWLRVLHYRNENDIFFITNEGKDPWKGALTLPSSGTFYCYDAYKNRLYRQDLMNITVMPMHSLIVIFDEPGHFSAESFYEPLAFSGAKEELACWMRSQCEGASYPDFEKMADITLPDHFEEEYPDFSGFIRYETSIESSGEESLVLQIENLSEGVEVFINGNSAGIQVAPPFLYDLTPCVHQGANHLVLEIATSLEREGYSLLTDPMMKQFTPAPSSRSGITGRVFLYRSRKEN